LAFPFVGSFDTSTPLHKLTEVASLDKFLNFIFQRLALLSGMSTVSVVLKPTSTVDILRARDLPRWCINLALRASSRILPLLALKGVYVVNQLPRVSLRLSLDQKLVGSNALSHPSPYIHWPTPETEF